MQGASRKILQAVLYEAGGVLFVAPSLALIYEQGMGYSTLLSLVISAVALGWNMLFNGLFEWWERRQPNRHRNWRRRLLHSLGFEGGLTLILTPVIGAWLGIGLWLALVTNLGLFVFFFFYSLVFQWVFDRAFDVPLSAQSDQGVTEQSNQHMAGTHQHCRASTEKRTIGVLGSGCVQDRVRERPLDTL